MFATSYLITAVVAGIERNIHDHDCKTVSNGLCEAADRMLIPVVGPFLTYQPLTVQLILAGPQILGLVLTVTGFYRASRPVPRRERATFDIHPTPLPGGGTLTATLRF
jgi:hypothetical protein